MNKKLKSFLSILVLFGFTIIFTHCSTGSTDTPKNYFDRAVLNINLMFGFADYVMSSQLEQPSVKVNDAGGSEPMKRVEVVESKISSLEENYEKVENLKVTADTKEMLTASLDLYKFVMPVYKNEYLQLAKLYDNGAPVKEIQALTNSIHEKYYGRFIEIYDRLIEAGKVYAEKNNIKVKWNAKTSPN